MAKDITIVVWATANNGDDYIHSEIKITPAEIEHIKHLALADGFECNAMLSSASPTSVIIEDELKKSIEMDKIVVKKLSDLTA